MNNKKPGKNLDNILSTFEKKIENLNEKIAVKGLK